MKKLYLFLLISVAALRLSAQTDVDAVMMFKNNICTGAMWGHSSWSAYWEGATKRTNANLGKVSATSYTVMANYGITSHLNVLVGLPYIQTKASGGQLHPMRGFQDFSVWLKWHALHKEVGKGTLSLFAIGGYSTPASNYSADFLPLSIGMGSKNVSLRGMIDYQAGDWFATGSATYVRRNNIIIDKDAYYTTQMHYTNEVQMPNATQYNLRAGLRNGRWIAEAVVANWTTQGGFDISRNNMPFPSNRMNLTTVGAHLKYETKFMKGLSFNGAVNRTVSGRNVGQSTGFEAGLFYAFKIASPKKSSTTKK